MLHQAIAWSPDGKYISFVAENGSALLVFSREGERIHRIEIKPSGTTAASNILWVKNGIIYLAETWKIGVYEKDYEVRLVNPFDGNETALWKTEGKSNSIKIMGSNDALVLFACQKSETEFEFVAVNIATRQIEKQWVFSAREVSQTDRFESSAPYLAFNTISVDFTPQVWFLDWDSIETKYLFSDVDFDTTGWSSALDGIGVFRKGSKGVELWVIKP